MRLRPGCPALVQQTTCLGQKTLCLGQLAHGSRGRRWLTGCPLTAGTQLRCACWLTVSTEPSGASATQVRRSRLRAQVIAGMLVMIAFLRVLSFGVIRAAAQD